MNEVIITKLKCLALRGCWCDDKDFNPYDYSGGNYDDAYYGGVHDGETMLARELLESLNVTDNGERK